MSFNGPLPRQLTKERCVNLDKAGIIQMTHRLRNENE